MIIDTSKCPENAVITVRRGGYLVTQGAVPASTPFGLSNPDKINTEVVIQCSGYTSFVYKGIEDITPRLFKHGRTYDHHDNARIGDTLEFNSTHPDRFGKLIVIDNLIGDVVLSKHCSTSRLEDFKVVVTRPPIFNPIILQQPIRVHCKTLLEAESLLAWAHINGFRWVGGDSFMRRTNFYKHPELAYNVFDGKYSNVENPENINKNFWTYEEALVKEAI